MPNDSTYLVRILGASGIEINEAEQFLLSEYVDLLLDWNKRVNLISRKDEEVWRNHILHSLAILTIFKIPLKSEVLDLGTGGGLPGIPLAIMYPDVDFVLIDSISKKTRAVSEISEALQLSNIQVETARLEDISSLPAFKSRFDICVTRAVSRMDTLVTWVNPVMKPGGTLIAWKGGDLGDELDEALTIHKGLMPIIREFKLQGEDYFTTEGKCAVFVQF